MKCIDDNAPDDVFRVLVGNKCDLHHQIVISTDEGRRLAERFHVDYFETSAKSENNSHVTKVFEHIAENLLQRKQTENKMESGLTTSVELKKSESNRMTTCCSTWQ